jgi:hypothetical protein
MTPTSGTRAQLKRRQTARIGLLKRRVAAVSVVAFASLFALAAHHVVRGASAARTQPARSSAQAPTTFFDEGDGGFQFEGGDGQPPSAPAPAPPVAQTSVS